MEGATFESSQTITNKMNYVMQQICELSRPVAVFLSGAVLPKTCYDPTLKQTIGADTEQSSYMGVYNVRWCEQEDPMEPSTIPKMISHFKKLCPHLKGSQLRFHLECSKRFLLVPNNNYPQRAGGYQHLKVDIRDNRKPLYEIAKGKSIEALVRVLNEREYKLGGSLFGPIPHSLY